MNLRTPSGVLLVLCSGCVIGDDDSSSEFVSQLEQAAYIAADTVWPSTTIPVCWENPNGSNLEGRGWVESAVRDTWEAHSALRFVGWAGCNDDSGGIRIRIKDDGPKVSQLGRGIDGLRDGMKLNFTFDVWATGSSVGNCNENREFCTRAVAVHEFGHAIGFAHEQNRPDTPAWCVADEQGTDGDVLVGPWDEGSVMNYCNPTWNGDGQLSPGDIEAVRLTYGAAFDRGKLLRSVATGTCLDVSDVSHDDGAMVHAWDCHGNANQRWDFVPMGDGSYEVVSRNSYKCLDVDAWSVSDGARIQQWACHGGDNQRWYLEYDGDGGYRLVSKNSGSCADVRDFDPSNGAVIWQWWCHGGKNQSWFLE